MKRLALFGALLACVAATVVTTAGADGTRSYQAELFNAFGLVKGSELRVAGVKAGTITDLGITPQKTAIVSFEVDSKFPQFKADASCSAEPQSLIAEYFLDCQPGHSAQPLQGPIPAARNHTTVQPDLVQNTLREPFKERLQLLINEFGTALTGNAQNLNAAIRAGSPALQQLKQVLNILGQQNTTIADLNTNADAVFAQLVARKEDLVRFIDNAGRTSQISAERRAALTKNFDLLDNFLAQLKPVMQQLGKLAANQTPELVDLHAAAPGLNKLAKHLPAFNDGSRLSLKTLGNAAAVGKVALANGRDEIQALDQASTKAYPAGDIVAKFLESISDPRNAVEEDSCARQDLRQQPGEADRRVQLLNQKLGVTLNGDQSAQCPYSGTAPPPGNVPGNPGYTGMEGLLNYAYIQANSLNLFDQLGHALHFTLINAPGSNPCATYQTGPSVPAEGGGTTTDPKKFAECAGILGDKQPGINYGTNPSGLFGHLRRYDSSVCPDGVINPSILTICNPDPNVPRGALHTQATTQPQQQSQQNQGSKIPNLLPSLDPNQLPQKVQDAIRKALGLGPNDPLPNPLPPGVTPNGVVPGATAPNGTTPNTAATPTPSATNDLLNFLFGP